jgi:hypothetical protein
MTSTDNYDDFDLADFDDVADTAEQIVAALGELPV